MLFGKIKSFIFGNEETPVEYNPPLANGLDFVLPGDVNPVVYESNYRWSDYHSTLIGLDRQRVFSELIGSGIRTILGNTILTGKKYWEILIASTGYAYMCGVSRALTDLEMTTYIGGAGSPSPSMGWYYASSTTYYNNGLSRTGTNYIGRDVLMFAYDSTTGDIWIGKNGTWLYSGDPANGTTPYLAGATTGFQNYNMYVAVTHYSGAIDNKVFLSPLLKYLKYSIPSGFSVLG